jgi:hypothetical protein
MTTYSGSAYYANPDIYNAFVGDTDLVITGQLIDTSGNGIQFDSELVKVTTGGIPTADGADQDLMINTEFRAFEDSVNGTVLITKNPS